jgi:hypothetical protein
MGRGAIESKNGLILRTAGIQWPTRNQTVGLSNRAQLNLTHTTYFTQDAELVGCSSIRNDAQ